MVVRVTVDVETKFIFNIIFFFFIIKLLKTFIFEQINKTIIIYKIYFLLMQVQIFSIPPKSIKIICNSNNISKNTA